MVHSIPTRGEMERNLSQSVQAFYRNQLGCQTKKVSCHILEDRITIAIMNPITAIEKLLIDANESQFVRDLRDRIDAIVKHNLIPILEAVVNVKVIAMTIDTTVSHNFTGIVALLSQKPNIRESKRALNKPKVDQG